MADINSVPYIPAYPTVDELAVEGAEGPLPAVTYSQSYHIGMSREHRSYGARPAPSSGSSSGGSNANNGPIAKAAAQNAAEEVPALPSMQYAATAKVPPRADPMPKLCFSSHSASMVSQSTLTPEMIENIEAPPLLQEDIHEDVLQQFSPSPPPLSFAVTAPVKGAIGRDRTHRITPAKFTLEQAKNAPDDELQEGFTMLNDYDDEEVDDEEQSELAGAGEDEDDNVSGDEAMDVPVMVRT